MLNEERKTEESGATTLFLVRHDAGSDAGLSQRAG